MFAVNLLSQVRCGLRVLTFLKLKRRFQVIEFLSQLAGFNLILTLQEGNLNFVLIHYDIFVVTGLTQLCLQFLDLLLYNRVELLFHFHAHPLQTLILGFSFLEVP